MPRKSTRPVAEPVTDAKPSEATAPAAEATKSTEAGTAEATSAADESVSAGADGANGDAEAAQAADAEATATAAAAAAALDEADKAPVAESSLESADEIAAAGGGDTAETLADQSSPAIGFPLRARVTNNTRMPVQVPALGLDLPASGEATITLYSEDDLKKLHSDLTAVYSLNRLGEEAFTVSPAETTEE